MTWREAQLRRDNIKASVCLAAHSPIFRDFYHINALEDQVSLLLELLRACYPYVPEVDAYGIDQRAIEEAIRGT